MKSLDNYLVTTLIFIGISVTTLLSMSIIDIIVGPIIINIYIYNHILQL